MTTAFGDNSPASLYNSAHPSDLIMHSVRSTKIGAVIFLLASIVTVAAQNRSTAESASAISTPILLQIVCVEDERRWDDTLKKFLADQNPQLRKRAALA